MEISKKKVVCCYYGSDLRSRGIHEEIDKISDLNITLQFDHLLLYKNLEFMLFPFQVDSFECKKKEDYKFKGKIKIVHSPTSRIFRGTNYILSVVEKIISERDDVEFVLLERLSRKQVLEIKKDCDIAIDQIGNRGVTGYGINSLETLAMGIPTVTDMTPDFEKWMNERDNPLIVANKHNLYQKLMDLIKSEDLRRKKGLAGRKWLKKYHSYENCHERLLALYQKTGIV